MRKIIAIIFSMLMLFSVALSACDKQEEPATYIATDGQTEYKVVVPEVMANPIVAAKDELLLFFEEATGVKLPVINDKDLIYSKNDKYISIGKTTLLEQVGIEPEAELGYSGTRIKTVDNSLFLYGKENFGALYAVYDLLNILFDYEYYGQNCYTLNNESSVQLPQLDFKNIPSIENRATAYNQLDDFTELNRFRQSHWYSDYFISIDGLPWHNDVQFLYGKLPGHENYWLATKDGVLLNNHMCYTARGDEGEYAQLIDTMFNRLKVELIANPDRYVACLSTADSTTVCDCEACTTIKNRHGGYYSAVTLSLCNDLIEKVYDWFDTDEGAPYKRDFKLCIMTYRETENAPVTFNEATGKYEFIGDLKINENVGIFLAIYGCAYPYSLKSSVNSDTYKNVIAWSDLTDNFYMWIYNTCFQSYFAPFDVFEYLQEYYQIMVERGVKSVISEGNHYSPNDSSAWSALKIYLNVKLQWDCNANVEELINNFCDNFYMDAAPYVKAVLNSFRVHSAHLKKTYPGEYGGKYSHDMNMYYTKYWPKDLMEQWNDLFTQGLKAIEKYQFSDPALYNVLYKRVSIEKMSPIYILLHLYSRNLSTDVHYALGQEFKRYAIISNLSLGEFDTPMEEIYQRLGIE